MHFRSSMLNHASCGLSRTVLPYISIRNTQQKVTYEKAYANDYLKPYASLFLSST